MAPKLAVSLAPNGPLQMMIQAEILIVPPCSFTSLYFFCSLYTSMVGGGVLVSETLFFITLF